MEPKSVDPSERSAAPSAGTPTTTESVELSDATTSVTTTPPLVDDTATAVRKRKRTDNPSADESSDNESDLDEAELMRRFRKRSKLISRIADRFPVDSSSGGGSGGGILGSGFVDDNSGSGLIAASNNGGLPLVSGIPSTALKKRVIVTAPGASGTSNGTVAPLKQIELLRLCLRTYINCYLMIHSASTLAPPPLSSTADEQRGSDDVGELSKLEKDEATLISERLKLVFDFYTKYAVSIINNLRESTLHQKYIVNDSFANNGMYGFIISQEAAEREIDVGNRINDPERPKTLLRIFNFWLVTCERNHIPLSFSREALRYFLHSYPFHSQPKDWDVRATSTCRTYSASSKLSGKSTSFFIEYLKSPRNFAAAMSRADDDDVDALMYARKHNICVSSDCYVHQTVPDYASLAVLKRYEREIETTTDKDYVRIPILDDVETLCVVKITPTAIYQCRDGATIIAPQNVSKDVPIELMVALNSIGVESISVETLARTIGSKPTRFVDVCSVTMIENSTTIRSGAGNATSMSDGMIVDLKQYDGKSEQDLLTMSYPDRLTFLKNLGLPVTDILRDGSGSQPVTNCGYIRKHLTDSSKPCYRYRAEAHKTVVVGYDDVWMYVAYKDSSSPDDDVLAIKTKHAMCGPAAQLVTSIAMNDRVLRKVVAEGSLEKNQIVTRHQRERTKVWRVEGLPDSSSFKLCAHGVLVRYNASRKDATTRGNERLTVDNTIEVEDLTYDREYKDIAEDAVSKSQEAKKPSNLSSTFNSLDTDSLVKLILESNKGDLIARLLSQNNRPTDPVLDEKNIADSLKYD